MRSLLSIASALVGVLQRNTTSRKYIYIAIDRYLKSGREKKELAHTIMEARSAAQDLWSVRWRPRNADGVSSSPKAGKD